MEVCARLIRACAEVNLQHVDGESALMIASHEGHKDVCRLLCENSSVNVNLKDRFCNTALMHATFEGKIGQPWSSAKFDQPMYSPAFLGVVVGDISFEFTP